MPQIIDRRFSDKNRSAVNRQRFIQRFKSQIKKAVVEAASRRSITDIEKGEKVVIPAKDLEEPIFRHGEGGRREMVYPLNKDFMTGDRIKRPLEQQGGDSQASNDDATGSDEFGFEISREEFLDLFFDDLALPDMIKKQLKQTPTVSAVRAGYKKYGTPTALNVRRSMRNALGRRIAFSMPYKKSLAEAEEELKFLQQRYSDDNPKIVHIKQNIQQLNTKITQIPFIDTFDLRFNNILSQPKLSTQAVMFCLMDVSGSMDETRKEMAKRFFILLYLFLTRNYQTIDLVFIRHHTTAKEVSEHEFFYSRETGGTVVSSALEMMLQIIHSRYPSSTWNIYVAQASDGDNWNADSPHCADLLMQQIMPQIQYYAYVEILPQVHQNLWEAYQEVHKVYKNFAMKSVDNAADIYPVLRELFKKRGMAS